MSAPHLALVVCSDAFQEQCTELAAAVGAQLQLLQSPDELAQLGEVVGVVVTAADVELEALDALQTLRARNAPDTVVVGSDTDYRVGISLLQAGASNYYALPPDFGGLRAWMLERIERATRAEAAQGYADDQQEHFDFSSIIGESPGLRVALERAARVIPHGGATVLLTGETGTGKDVLARAIHFNGPRAAKPFVEVNCTALPANLLEAELFGYEPGAFTDARTAKPGLFEVADGGTLFLDEIGDLSLELQAKLLRVLEDKRVRRLGSVRSLELDVRIITATHVDLQQAVKDGRFRRDLYYRLNVASIHLPPLRERGGDVLLLAEHFLQYFSQEYGVAGVELTPEVRRLLRGYAWPGNIRELRNAIERAVLFGEGFLREEDLLVETSTAEADTGVLPFPASLRDIECAAAQAMVEHCGGNKTEAAKTLGISRKQLYTLLREKEAAPS